MWLRTIAVLLLVIAASAGLSPPGARSQPPGNIFDFDTGSLPPVGAIIDRMIERAEAQDETGAELSYEARIVTRIDTLNAEGEVTKTEEWLHKRYPVESQLFDELIARDGQPLDEQERREQAERRDKFAREARERADKGDGRVETGDERQIRLTKDLMSRFEASVVGLARIEEESHYVIEFKPRDGKLPEKTRMDRALNRSSGSLYVARSDYGLRRVEFQTGRSVGFFLGLARLRSARGLLEFERVARDVWLPKRYDFGIDLRVFFSNRRQQIEREWVKRRLLPPLSPA